MPWVIGNSTNYIWTDHTGKYKTTGSIHRAQTFAHRATAENFLRSMPKKLKGLNYRVMPHNEPPVVRPEVDIDQSVLEPQYYLDSIQAFRTFIETMKKQQSTLETARHVAELEIEDIEHAAEFYELNAEQGYQLYSLLREARIRRRKCKNALAWIQFVLDACPDDFLERDPSARIAGTGTRAYAPRALPGLFDGTLIKPAVQ